MVRRAPRRAGSDELVARPALVQRLVEARDAPVAVIVAPAGYGKSTLLSEWAGSDQRPFWWLRPDAVDAEHADGLDDLLEALVAHRKSFVLVIDDADRAAPELLHELVRVVAEECVEGSTVALSSRSEPPVPLGRLRAGRALVEMRIDDLAMSSGEAAVLLRRAGLGLDVGLVQTLVRRTGGWPGALYLAALSLREQRDLEESVAMLRGDDHRLAEYFDDEVLSVLSPELERFAVRTAVLDELSGPVCDALLLQHDSAQTLAALGHASPLLRPLDAAHESYRWNTLLRDALMARLRRTEPELVSVLHERASHWHETHGATDLAIDHAVRAHDPARSGELLWGDIVAYVTQGRNDIVRGWLGSFSDDELAEHPRLALCAAHSLLAAGNAADARHWAIAGAATRERARGPAEAAAPTPGFAGIAALVGRSGLSGMAEACALACQLEPDDSPWRPIWLLLRGAALHLTGDSASAKQLLAEGAELSETTAPSVFSLCLAQAVMIAIEEGDWETAAELADRAAGVIEERELTEYPLSALAFAAIAAARAHQGRADEAKRDVRRGVDLLTALHEFPAWYGAEARILLAHASLGLADIVGARALLAEASRLARRADGAVIFTQWFANAWAYIDTLAETRLTGPSALTIAELRILRFLPSHRSFREIADQLGVSANTVKTQAHAVYRKLGAASRSEAVARAEEAGLLGQ